MGKSECFMRTIQRRLSLKLKTFSEYSSEFLKFKLNFEHFEKKSSLLADLF